MRAGRTQVAECKGQCSGRSLGGRGFGWIKAQGRGGVMQAGRGGSARSWSFWALLILLWTVTAAGDENVNTIALGAAPQSLALNPTTNIIYVTANNAVSTNPGSVYVVDAVKQTLITAVTVGISPGTGPNGIAVNGTTNKTYVANYGSGTVSVIDGNNSYAVHSVTVGTAGKPAANIGPDNIAVNQSTDTIYVTNYLDNTVSAIDGATEKVTTVATGTGPRWLAVNPVTNEVYVANQDGTVTVINGASDKTTSIPVGANLSLGQIAVNTQTNKIYVANNTAYATGIAVIDGTTNTVTKTVSCSPSWGVAVNSATNLIYASNYTVGTVTVIDGSSNGTVVLAAPSQPKSIAINPAINRVYVASYLGSAVTVIDGASNQIATIAVGSEPASITVSVNPDLVFVANAGSSSLSVINPNASFTPAPPTVSITSPANGGTVSGTVAVQASASAGLALAGVQFSLDGVKLGLMVTSTPYAVSWDTTQSTNGSHTITAVAQDSGGNTASASVTVTVANGTSYFSLSVAPSANSSETIAPGSTASYLLNLVSGTTFSGTVSLTCSGAPATTVCSISPASPALAASTTLPVTVTVVTAAAIGQAARPGRLRAPFTFVFALLGPFGFAAWRGNRRRKALWRWVAGGLLALAMLLASCGGGGSLPVTSFPLIKAAGTASGSYTLTITATSGSVTSTVNLTLTVT